MDTANILGRITAVASSGTRCRRNQPDLISVMQRSHADTDQVRDRTDRERLSKCDSRHQVSFQRAAYLFSPRTTRCPVFVRGGEVPVLSLLAAITGRVEWCREDERFEVQCLGIPRVGHLAPRIDDFPVPSWSLHRCTLSHPHPSFDPDAPDSSTGTTRPAL